MRALSCVSGSGWSRAGKRFDGRRPSYWANSRSWSERIVVSSVVRLTLARAWPLSLPSNVWSARRASRLSFRQYAGYESGVAGRVE